MSDDTCKACGETYSTDDDGANLHYCAQCRAMYEALALR